ncbi:helix-turn-helix domain-containing protein [Moraxella atlantae]|uniref:helix-turn-helix domain-containing protein n=1 Tax=Faucicola atlantae TaxID=34059 RepID=UPI0037509AF4
MLKAYKYRIYPNSEQQALLIEKHFGCSRFVFNWALALALQKRYYAMFGKSLSRTQIQHTMTVISMLRAIYESKR